MKVNDLVFVYGTLRRGGHWHGQGILGDAPPMVAEGTLRGTMHNVWGRVPAIKLQGDYNIVGELYSLGNEDIINRLKRLEAGYDCSLVDVSTDEGPRQAWVFHWAPEKLERAPVVECADWMQYMEETPSARF